MSFNYSDRRRKETKLLTQAILQMTQKRKVQASFAASGEHDERRRPDGNLRDVLHMQARTFVSLCCDDARSLSDFSFKEFSHSRSWNAYCRASVAFSGN